MGISDGDAGYMGSYDTCYTSRDDTFADIHNLDQCINYLNQSLVTIGFPSGLNLYSSEPASIVRTCNCMYAMIQQRQRDIEYCETANETRQRLISDVSRLEAKVETLTDQLASKERKLQAITSKAPGSCQEASASLGVAAQYRQIQSQPLRHKVHDMEVGEKVKLENKMRQWQDSKPKTPVKPVPARSPLRPKTPAHDRLCPFSPSMKSVKRALGADSFSTPRSRFSEKAGAKVLQVDGPSAAHKDHERLKKTLDFELRKPMDIIDDSVTSTSEEQLVQCSGSILLPDENISLSPLVQYDNPMYQEESPPLSARLKSLEINMRVLSPNMDSLHSKEEFSPTKLSNASTMNSDISQEFEIMSCTTPERETTMHEQGPSVQTPDLGSAQVAPSTSGSLTPFQQFKHNRDLQMTLVKEYLTVLNSATREELLQLKGIGPKRAADVLEMRQRCEEPFKDLQDLGSIGLSERQAYSMFNSNIVQKVILPST